MTRAWLVLTAAVAAVSGCGDDFDPRPTRVVIDPDSDDFWALPMPDDRRRQDDGTFDIDQWPGQLNRFVRMWLSAADATLTDGWGLSAGVVFQTSGPIDVESLPADPAASLRSDASVFLLDVDPDSPERGRRIPLRVTVPEPDLLTADNLVTAAPVPGFLRRPKTTYALVITDALRDPDGSRLGRSRPFHAAWTDSDAGDRDLRRAYGLVRGTLAAESFGLGRVVGAAVFSTMEPMRELRPLSEWVERQPTPALATPWTVAEAYESYQVLTATWRAPVIQEGQRPYERRGDGAILWGEDGEPVVVDHQPVRLALTVPKSPQPAAGFPLMMYLHGSGGEWYEAINRGPQPELPEEERSAAPPGTGLAAWLARMGVATVAFDFPLHGNRASPPDTSGLKLYNLLTNVEATLGNFPVAVMEALFTSRLMLATAVDGTLASTLDPGGATDGMIRFDPARLTAMGQSMGSWIGLQWAGLDPRVKGIVLSGVGGSLIEIATKALEPYDVNAVVALTANLGTGERLDDDDPFLHAMQQFWDYVEPGTKAPHLVLEPHPGGEPKHVMMTAGFRDGYFHPNAQATIAVPLGIPPGDRIIEPVLEEAMWLAGRAPEPYPVRGNIEGRTAAFVQYEAPYNLGHYVVFNQDEARYQVACFIASVGTQTGAVIAAPAHYGEPCP